MYSLYLMVDLFLIYFCLPADFFQFMIACDLLYVCVCHFAVPGWPPLSILRVMSVKFYMAELGQYHSDLNFEIVLLDCRG